MSDNIVTHKKRVIVLYTIFIYLFIIHTHMKVTPLGDRVLIKLKEKEEVTAFGIVLPDTVDKK